FYATSSFLARVFDLGAIDGVVNGVGALVRRMSTWLRRAQTGFVRSYGLVMLLGVGAIVAYFLLVGVGRWRGIMLSIIIFLPLLGAVIVALLPRASASLVRAVALIASVVTFVASLAMLFVFIIGQPGYQL